jgi:DNA-binding CsgD family transcriptional regulator
MLKIDYIIVKGNAYLFKKLELFILTILFSSNITISQNKSSNFSFGHPKVKSFLREEYKAHRQNWSISASAKTSQIFFANSKGLLAFNGNDWHLYPFPQIIRSVLVDSKDRIFTGALGEFGYWEKNNKKGLIYHSLKFKIPDKNFEQEAIWNIIETKGGVLFQSFAYAYLFTNENKIKKINLPTNINYFAAIDNNIYVPGIGNGIFKTTDLETFSLLEGSLKVFQNESVSAILKDPNNKEPLICTTKGIFQFKNGAYSPLSQPLNLLLQKYHLNKALLIDANRIAIGTILNGLLIINLKGEILQEINKDNGLANNTILSLNLDQEHNLWAGLDNGISMIELESPIKYFQDISGELGAVYDAEFYNGSLYVGTNHGVFMTNTNNFKNDFKLVSGTQGQVWNLEKMDEVLLAGHNDGTFQINGNNSIKISPVTGGWKTIRLTNSPNLLAQGTYNKIIFFKKNEQNNWTYSHELEGFTNSAKQILEDTFGNIWAKTGAASVACLTLDIKKQKILFRGNYHITNPKISNVNLVEINGSVQLISPEMILIFDPILKQFKPKRPQQNNLKPIKIFSFSKNESLTLYDGGDLSFHSKNGNYPISVFSKSTFVDDYEAIKVLNDSLLFFCLEDGFAYVSKHDIVNQKSKSSYYPDFYKIEFEKTPELNYFFNGSALKTFEFPYSANTIKVLFSPGVFSKTVQFSYLLEGYNENWSEFQPQNYKAFYNLPPGSYSMQLKTNLNNARSIFRFKILPPWYLSIWAQLAYICIALAFAFFIYFLHLRNIDKHKTKLKEKHKKEVEIQQQEIIKLRNEQLESDLIRKSEELANSTMTLIKKNELLSKIKDDAKVDKSISTQKTIINLIEKNISTEHDWKVFETNFNQVHETFLKKLTALYPAITHGDLKLAAYLRMNLNTKEISQLLNITQRSVELKRYRLRKKLNISTDENLNDIMMKL